MQNNSKKVWWALGIIIVIVFVVVVFNTLNKKHIDKNIAPYKIGAALALSGDAASWGENERNAINLAVDEINKKGGIQGRAIEVVIEDTKSTSRDTINALQKLLNVDTVDAIVGPTWFDSYPGGATLMGEFPNKIMVIPSASIDVVNGDVKRTNVFSTFARPKIQAELLGQYLKEKGDKKISVIFQNDAYFQEFLANFKNGYGESNLNITGELVNYGDNIRPILEKVKKQSPDIVLFGLYDQAAIYELLKSRNQYFGNAEIWSNDNADAYLDYEGVKKDFLAGVNYITTRDPDQKFIANYQTRYNTSPKYSAANAYDAVYLVKRFVENDMNFESLRHVDITTAAFGKIQLDDIGGVDTKLKPYCVKKINPTGEESETQKCW